MRQIVIMIKPLGEAFAKIKRLPRLPRLQADVMQYRQRAAYRKLWRNVVIAAVYEAGGPPKEPFEHAEITGIRSCTGVPPDRCNVWYSFKCLVDAVTPPRQEKRGRGVMHFGGIAIIEDDNPSVVRKEDYYSAQVSTKQEEGIYLRIREVA